MNITYPGRAKAPRLEPDHLLLGLLAADGAAHDLLQGLVAKNMRRRVLDLAPGDEPG